MQFKNLNMLSDFMQVLNIRRRQLTKIDYFYKCKYFFYDLFTTKNEIKA
jgi:hypothetical protein